MESKETSEENVKKYCGFKLGEQVLALNIDDIREVTNLLPIKSVPLSPDVVAGLINLRGSVLTCIRLGEIFKNVPLRKDHSEEIDTRKIVVISYRGESIALIVDGIYDVFNFDSNAIETEINELFDNESKFIAGIGKYNKENIIFLNKISLLDLA